ncbi:MAG: ClpXP protease specificity-enhancing factor [Gammaproteobacteria bacterium]|nr:ClpXP protease specificity-enhancing factor [Gammaproteobacteria bacterium]
MTSNRPYLLRALYDWILANNMTPYLLVDATVKGVNVPTRYVKGGKIVLNVVPSAAHNLELGNEKVSFNARFNGKQYQIIFPVKAVTAIYARENGKGLIFPDDDHDSESHQKTEPNPKQHLKVIK